MTKTLFKTHGLIALIACSLGFSGLASAHTQAGALGAAAAATDYYAVTCSDDGSGPPARLDAQILGTAGPLTAIVVNKGVAATSSGDVTAGDAVASPLVPLAGAAGVYNVFIRKAGSGAVNYTLTFHCMTAGNLHTGTAIATRQNQ